MIAGFIGDIGGGKTASMIRDVYIKYLQGRKIYSNIKLNFDYEPITIEDLIAMSEGKIDINEAVIVLDELHIYMDSRTSASKRNRIISYFGLQTRKMDVDLYYTTQYINQVDLRIRNLTNCLVECYTTDSPYEKDVKYTLNIINYRKINKVVTKKSIFKTNNVYSLYDTKEVVRI